MFFNKTGFSRYKEIPGVQIYQPTKISGIKNITFGKDVIIDSFSYIYALRPLIIGNNVHIASHVFIGAGDEITIGNFAGIFHGARIYATSDDFKGSGFGNPTMHEKFRNLNRAPVTIGDFSIIGANCVILPGVSIGDGVSVGAGSVITRDLEPWGIYIGNKRVGERDKEGIMKNFNNFKKEYQ